jgi:transposase
LALSLALFILSQRKDYENSMPNRKIDRGLKIAAMRLYDRKILTVEEICEIVGFSVRTFWRVKNIWDETGDVIRKTHGIRGRPRLLVHDDILYLVRLVKHRPDWFLEELAELLDTNRFISVHFVTIFRTLERAGYSVKKLRKLARERSPVKRM